MDDFFKNSLKGQLSDTQRDYIEDDVGIIFDAEKIKDSPFAQIPQGINFKDNLFEQAQPLPNNNIQKFLKKRLNDLDANIMQEGAFVDVYDSELQTGEKIKKIERLIKEHEQKISIIEDDKSPLKIKLVQEKDSMQKIAVFLRKENQTAGIGAAITYSAQDAIKKLKSLNVLKSEHCFFEKFLYKYFPKIYKSKLVKSSLCKLRALNQSAYELINKTIPYGEQDSRYSDLIAYLSSANTIHAKLRKKI